MKQILMALVFTAIAYTGAEAQAKKCGANEGQVCQKNGTGCYKTSFAQNFPVCKGPAGYYTCCNNAQATTNTAKPSMAQHTTYVVADGVMPVNEETMPRDLYEDDMNNSGNAAGTAATGTAPNGQVCRKNGNKTQCYQTPYAQNYKVCKGANGYHVCGE